MTSLPKCGDKPTTVAEALFQISACGFDLQVQSWNDTLEIIVANRPWCVHVAHRSLPDLIDPEAYCQAIIDCVSEMMEQQATRLKQEE